MRFRGVFAASTKGHRQCVSSLDDSLVAGGSDGVVRFWSMPAGKFTSTSPRRTLATHWGLIAAHVL